MVIKRSYPSHAVEYSLAKFNLRAAKPKFVSYNRSISVLGFYFDDAADNAYSARPLQSQRAATLATRRRRTPVLRRSVRWSKWPSPRIASSC